MYKRGMLKMMLFSIIFLLILLYIGVLSTEVLRALGRGKNGVIGAAACTVVEISPASCSYKKNIDGTFDLSVKAAYQGTLTSIKELHILLTDARTQNVIQKSVAHIPSLLENSEVYTLNLSSKEYSYVAIAPTIVSEDGTSDFTCSPSESIECIEH